MVVDTKFIAGIIVITLLFSGLMLLFQQINIPQEHVVSCPLIDYNNYSAYNNNHVCAVLNKFGGDIRWIS